MKKVAYPVGLVTVVLGVLLIVTSAIWPRLTSTADYTREDGEAYAKAAGNYHKLSFQNANKPDKQVDVLAAEAEYQRRRERLDQVRERPAKIAALLKWSGVAVAVVGACFLLYHKSVSPS